jgi:hypothetical protein
VHIDEDKKEVRFGVPLDASTTVNKVLTVNYRDGWENPTVTYRGVLVRGRQWSLDDIPATMALSVRRTLAVSIDRRIDQNQVLFASSVDGNVNMIVPDVYNDNGAAIQSVYQPAFISSGDAMLQFGGAQGSLKGAGSVVLSFLTDDDDDYLDDRQLDLTLGDIYHYSEETCGEGEHFGIKFRNGVVDNGVFSAHVADSFFELHTLSLYSRVMWAGRSD